MFLILGAITSVNSSLTRILDAMENALMLSESETARTIISIEEEDLLARSSKTIKNANSRDVENTPPDPLPKLGSNLTSGFHGGPSFADKLKGMCAEEVAMAGKNGNSNNVLSNDSMEDSDQE